MVRHPTGEGGGLLLSPHPPGSPSACQIQKKPSPPVCVAFVLCLHGEGLFE